MVVPSYNEASVLEQTVQGLIGFAPNIVLVDDGSSDDTPRVAASLPVHYLRHVVNLGQGAALQTGIDYSLNAGASYIVTFDADGQMCPGQVAKVCAALRQHDVDVALGSRFLPESLNEIPKFRRSVLRLATWFTARTTGLKLTDTHNGFRAFTRKAALKIRLRQNRMAHASEILQQIQSHNLSYVEVPVDIRYTRYSRQKGQSAINGLNILWDLNFQ